MCNFSIRRAYIVVIYGDNQEQYIHGINLIYLGMHVIYSAKACFIIFLKFSF